MLKRLTYSNFAFSNLIDGSCVTLKQVCLLIDSKMKKAKTTVIVQSFLAFCCFVLMPPTEGAAQNGMNKFTPWASGETPQTGMYWPNGQAMPHFAVPAGQLDGLSVASKELTGTEKIMLVSFQGLINRKQPRIFLFETEREGKYKWPKNLGLEINEYPVEKRWELIGKYKKEISGVILYSVEKSEHYKNLASTVGGLRNALPVTKKEYDDLKNAGIQFPVLEDLSGLNYATPVEIYQYMYDHYWAECSKRLLISLNTREGYIRDLGVAAGTAIVWLDPRKSIENTMIRKFLCDMKAGESIMTGWWAEERSGIGVGVEYGISTIPSDFYENATVYAGMPHQIDLPVVPKKPELENKIYLAVFLSDGDNVQYCQHAMSDLWDNKNRGIIPINWTVSPGLADLGPGLLNYYYKTATPNDFFASGPSGLGYALIYDAHNKVWNTTRRNDLDPYAKFTQQYLEKSGLRVITIWDEINDEQMDSYTTHCRYLYGVTQQDWEKREKLQTVVKQDKLSFIPNLPCYASGVDVIYSFWKDTIAAFDGSRPLFLTAQGESWKMGPENIVELKKQLEQLSPGNIVICRGDHFFALHNEANQMDYNLTLSGKMKITSSPTATQPAFAADGTVAGEHTWVSSGNGEKWIQFDLGKKHRINRYVVRHAGMDGMSKSLNTKSFKLEVSTDGSQWTVADMQTGNGLDVSDIDITPVDASYVRLTILDAGADGIARIGDVELYGGVKL